LRSCVITPGFNLPAKHVIHAAGPVYRDGKQGHYHRRMTKAAKLLDMGDGLHYTERVQ